MQYYEKIFEKDQVPTNVKYSQKKKFEPKLLVWLAISEEGHSHPFFVPSRGDVKGNVYLEECILRRLVPFLQQYHADDDREVKILRFTGTGDIHVPVPVNRGTTCNLSENGNFRC